MNKVIVDVILISIKIQPHVFTSLTKQWEDPAQRPHQQGEAHAPTVHQDALGCDEDATAHHRPNDDGHSGQEAYLSAEVHHLLIRLLLLPVSLCLPLRPLHLCVAANWQFEGVSSAPLDFNLSSVQIQFLPLLPSLSFPSSLCGHRSSMSWKPSGHKLEVVWGCRRMRYHLPQHAPSPRLPPSCSPACNLLPSLALSSHPSNWRRPKNEQLIAAV